MQRRGCPYPLGNFATLNFEPRILQRWLEKRDEKPSIVVNVPKQPAPVVNIENVIESPEREIKFKRRPMGHITSATVKDVAA